MVPIPPYEAPDEQTISSEDYALAYQEGYRRTVRFLAASGAPLELAEEVAQAAWVRGWERLGQLRQVHALGFWINTIARNILRNSYRLRQSSTELQEATLICNPLESEGLDAERIFAGCNAVEKRLLVRYYVEGFTSEELAGEMGLSAVGVRVKLLRLKRDLVVRFPMGAHTLGAPIDHLQEVAA